MSCERAKPAAEESTVKPRSLYSQLEQLEGTIRIAPSVDLTEPPDPEWGKRTYSE